MANYPEDLVILNGLTAAPTPPVRNSGNGWAPVPRSWAGGSVDDFDLEIWATGSNAVTVAKLVGAVPEVLASLSDQTVTGADFANRNLTATSHAYTTGVGPVRLTNSGGAVPAQLATGVDYWIIVVDANTVQLARDLLDALNGQAIQIGDAGSGTNKIVKTATSAQLRWLSLGFLGENADGAVTLTAAMGWRGRIKHSIRTVAYGLVATFGSAVATTVLLHPLPLTHQHH